MRLQTRAKSLSRLGVGPVCNDTLAQILALFFPYCENLCEAEFESSRQVCLAEEISRQCSIDSVTESPLITQIQVYKEKAQVGQKKYKNVQFGKENNTRKFKFLVKFGAEKATILKEIRAIKQKLLVLHWNCKEGVRLHPVKAPIYERREAKGFLML